MYWGSSETETARNEGVLGCNDRHARARIETARDGVAHGHALLHGQEVSVHGDAGYTGLDKRERSPKHGRTANCVMTCSGRSP